MPLRTTALEDTEDTRQRLHVSGYKIDDTYDTML